LQLVWFWKTQISNLIILQLRIPGITLPGMSAFNRVSRHILIGVFVSSHPAGLLDRLRLLSPPFLKVSLSWTPPALIHERMTPGFTTRSWPIQGMSKLNPNRRLIANSFKRWISCFVLRCDEPLVLPNLSCLLLWALRYMPAPASLDLPIPLMHLWGLLKLWRTVGKRIENFDWTRTPLKVE
jgi:hypothetical protein